MPMNEIEVLPLPNGALRRPLYVDNFVLAAGVAESFTVPSGAAFLFISSDSDIWVNYVPDGAELDLVTNGAFAADSAWTKGDGWTIAAGVATSDASQAADADLEQPAEEELVQGKAYRLVYTVSGYAAGAVVGVVGGTEGTDRTANGTYTETIRAGATDVVAIRADADFQGSIDNVSLTPIAAEPSADVTGGGGSELNPTYRYVEGDQRLDLYSAAGGKGSLAWYAFTRASA